MPTPAEKRALVFLTALLSLGAGVRATKAISAEPPPPSAVARAELHRQIVAVDSADSAERSGGGKRHRSKRPKAIGISTSDGSDAARIDSAATLSSRKRKRGTKILPQSAARARDMGVSTAGPVDLDRAQEWEVLALPKIGPTLAHRILADRDSLGPFGSIDELRRVKGVGEAVVDAIMPYVTFSQQPRQSREKEGDGVAAKRGVKRRKRQTPSQ
ncbi:MAG: helix-hairpin-helix domain-containing protein [Gemmatimonadaceae bacterium]